MRPIVFLLALAAASSAFAGRLDVAVIQFSGELTPEQLAAAFSRVSLVEITNSDRTVTSESDLKAGTVLFVQSLPISRGSSFSLSTRIRNDRADIEGSLGASSVSVQIALMSGVKLGLRNFERTVYSGSGTLTGTGPEILGIKQRRLKAPKVVKGSAKVESSVTTTTVVVQYTP